MAQSHEYVTACAEGLRLSTAPGAPFEVKPMRVRGTWVFGFTEVGSKAVTSSLGAFYEHEVDRIMG